MAISTSGLGMLVEGSSSNTKINCGQLNKQQSDTLEVPLRKFKGIVRQQSGRWGAQIYVKNQRFWLGTFKTQNEAAHAYDIVANMARGDKSVLNFPATTLTLHENMFQFTHSFEEVARMIRDGTYHSNLLNFMITWSPQLRDEARGLVKVNGIWFQPLFHKELTPSDVSHLSGLVIPKKYATAYLPSLGNINSGADNDNSESYSIELTLRDMDYKTWNFFYSYWNSCTSFVFTGGWGKFVRDKGLREKDIIMFYASLDGGMLLMDHVRRANKRRHEMILNLQLGARVDMEDNVDQDACRGGEKNKKLKLFGVEIK